MDISTFFLSLSGVIIASVFGYFFSFDYNRRSHATRGGEYDGTFGGVNNFVGIILGIGSCLLAGFLKDFPAGSIDSAVIASATAGAIASFIGVVRGRKIGKAIWEKRYPPR
jgi:hypothetical protein